MVGKRTYRVWEEGRAPDVVVETVSRSNTRKQLEEDKRCLYARMGISEYFVFDMRPKSRKPALIRFRLHTDTGTTERKESWGEPLRSAVLDTDLRPDGERLYLIDPETQSPYRGGDEERRQRKAVEARAELFKSRLADKDRENQILKQQLPEMRERGRLRRRKVPDC